MSTSFFRDKAAVMIVYDVTKPDTLNNIREWMDYVDYYCDDYTPVILVGNKIDIKDQEHVSKEEVEKLAAEFEIDVDWGRTLFQTSAKTGENVEEVFAQFIRTARNNGAYVMNQHYKEVAMRRVEPTPCGDFPCCS